MKRFTRVLLYLFVAAIILIGAVVVYLLAAYPKVGPAPELTVERTPERIERGRYLANHVMLCMDCHAERDFSLFSGPPKPGTEGVGGDRFDQTMGFPGVFYARNITPAGVGGWTDGELYRLITTGVTRDGRPMFPVMPYPNYGQCDPEDIKSVIAYLRSLPAVQHDVPESKPDFPFNLILRTMPTEAKPTKMPSRSDLAAYGKYLATAAACADCHTEFEKGEYVGEPFSGGRSFTFPDGSTIRTSNLTPHDATGIGQWTAEQFVARFKMYADSSHRAQPVAPGEFQTIMPWEMYAGMDSTDLAAIYAYLRTLPPVDKKVEKFTLAKK